VRRRIVWILGVGFALLGLAAVGAAVGWRDLRAARAHLVAARSTLQRAVSNPELLRTPAGRSQARGEIDRALVEIGAAQQAVHQSPALTASRIVPLVSRQRGGVAQLVDDSRTGALAARRLPDSSLLIRCERKAGSLPSRSLVTLSSGRRRTAPLCG